MQALCEGDGVIIDSFSVVEAQMLLHPEWIIPEELPTDLLPLPLTGVPAYLPSQFQHQSVGSPLHA